MPLSRAGVAPGPPEPLLPFMACIIAVRTASLTPFLFSSTKAWGEVSKLGLPCCTAMTMVCSESPALVMETTSALLIGLPASWAYNRTLQLARSTSRSSHLIEASPWNALRGLHELYRETQAQPNEIDAR